MNTTQDKFEEATWETLESLSSMKDDKEKRDYLMLLQKQLLQAAEWMITTE